LISEKLSPGEMDVAEFVAENRYKKNRERGTVDKQVGSQSFKETEFIGICAEIAFCKHYNLFPDFNNEGRERADCRINGKTVDVKGTKYSTGKLLLRKKDDQQVCDIYVLVTGTPPHMTLRGWLRSQEFVNQKHLGRLKPTTPVSYIATQEELHVFHS